MTVWRLGFWQTGRLLSSCGSYHAHYRVSAWIVGVGEWRGQRPWKSRQLWHNLLSFSLLARSSMVRICWVSHDLRFRKPCWQSGRILFLLKWDMMVGWMTWCYTLHTIHVSEFDWSWMKKNGFPSLKTGVTMADFHFNEILSLLIEIWKRWARPRANSSAASFKSVPWMLSGPVAL